MTDLACQLLLGQQSSGAFQLLTINIVSGDRGWRWCGVIMGNAALDHDNCPDPTLDSPPSATHVRQNLSKLKLVSLQALAISRHGC